MNTQSKSAHDLPLSIDGFLFNIAKEREPCLNKDCPECHGTGRKKDSSMCAHFISCPCPIYSPIYQ